MKTALKELISENKQALLNAPEYPLLNNSLLDKSDLPDLQALNGISVESIISELGEYPKFKNVQSGDLINLRLLLHLNAAHKRIENWCEKIIRYVEIRYKDLRNNEKRYGRSKQARISLFNQVLALFVEYYLQRNDIIFLNTALKLVDLKWMEPIASTSISTKVLRQIKLAQIDSVLLSIEHE